VIGSSSQAVIFTGKAAASVGYPSSVTVSSISYSINGGTAQSVAVTPGNSITWSLAATFPVGLSTIVLTATDSKGNVSPSVTYEVLVDTAAPTFTFSTATSNNGVVVVSIATAEGDFNPATFTATYNGVAVPSSSIAWGTAPALGSAGTQTATISGLTTGTGTLTVSGSTYAGLSGTASETLTVTIAFADSITFTTSSATWSTVGAYSGITVPVTNSWNLAQTVVVYATLKSGTSIYVLFGTVTVGPGATATVFVTNPGTTIPAGTYSVTFSAVTTSNFAVSAPVTPITVVT